MLKQKLLDLLWFTREEAYSCIFAVGIFGGLVLTRYVSFGGLQRYDFMLLLCIAIQLGMLLFKLETLDELKVICMFHLLGLSLEIFKVHIGSWSYPDAGFARIGGVPLYSGFMYAAIASYMCQAWRRVDLKVSNVPMRATMVAAVLIYANFYTNHWLPDLRWPIVALAIFLLRGAWIRFKVRETIYKMHIVVSFALIGFMVWLAENVGTYIGAWRYPSQANGWHIVHGSKVGSWAILVVFSFMLILWLKSEKQILAKKQKV